MGGQLALAAHRLPAKDVEAWWLPTAEELVRGCYESFHRTDSGLAPESLEFYKAKVVAMNLQYIQRPETLESLFYVYRATGNETYRDWSYNIFHAINTHLKTPWGFAQASDVTELPVPLMDKQETFMAAEVLKYALLIQLPASALPLDKYVFTTEAHPVLIAS